MKYIIFIVLAFTILSCNPSIHKLIDAIENEDEDKVAQLIDGGINLNDDNLKEQPLSIAIHKENYEIVKLLVSSGSDVNISREVLNFLLDNRHISLIILLLDNGFNPNSKINDKNMLIDWAIKNKEKSLINKLVENGADLNLDARGSGYNSFQRAFRTYDLDLIKLMISNGADINWKNKDGRNVLSIAITSNRIDVAKYLIGNGADLTLAGSSKLGPWEELAEYWNDGFIDIANTYWEKGLRFPEKDFYALHIAVKYHHYKYIEWLLRRGASPSIRDKDGFLPGDYAYSNVKSITIDEYETRDERIKVGNKIIELINEYK